jgi:hypothetical protein
MKRYLLYCIFRRGKNEATKEILGVDGQPVFLISKNWLSAAVSKISLTEPARDISRLIAYKNVIEFFHHERTVIPMRYGCVIEGDSRVIQFLETNLKQYDGLLRELEGCVEMGIRLMIDDCRLSIEGLKNHEMKPETQNSKLETPGKAYLETRKVHYEEEDKSIKERNEMIDRYREAFAGLFIRCKTEAAPILNRQSPIVNSESPMLSFYFLVPRKSIDSFRQVFRRINARESAKFLLSGPWPPYNFVMPDYSQNPSEFPGIEGGGKLHL